MVSSFSRKPVSCRKRSTTVFRPLSQVHESSTRQQKLSDQRREKALELAKQRRKADNALALNGNH